MTLHCQRVTRTRLVQQPSPVAGATSRRGRPALWWFSLTAAARYTSSAAGARCCRSPTTPGSCSRRPMRWRWRFGMGRSGDCLSSGPTAQLSSRHRWATRSRRRASVPRHAGCGFAAEAKTQDSPMPEGDTVWLTAQRLHQALADRELTLFDLLVPQQAAAYLRFQTVQLVLVLGKLILLRKYQYL